MPPDLEKLKVRFGELILEDQKGTEKTESSIPVIALSKTPDTDFAGSARTSLAEDDSHGARQDPDAQEDASSVGEDSILEAGAGGADSLTRSLVSVSPPSAVRRFGFGTAEETRSIRVRRRKA
ncbi:hypothetical protein GMOD_00010210 [Pyrenophora seminiperda CCB06]|uniref:Uncharacterized protein n=1 Tax=Pyrenophora seminiperda CCB06 TaxID=1302712 RepID=A0A3M7MD87_9PLEO|nr:hypothetical protein GMOD_00010210 [Pyrenophora seminiperda CCB06]